MEPLPGSRFDNVVNIFALLKRIQKRGEPAQIQRRCTHIQQVVMQSHEFCEDRAQITTPGSQLDIQQLFDRVMPGNLVSQGEI